MKILLLFMILLSSCMASNEPEPPINFNGLGWVSFGSNVSDTVDASLTRTHVLLSRGSDTLLYDTVSSACITPEFFCGIIRNSHGDTTLAVFTIKADSLQGSYSNESDNGQERRVFLQLQRQ